MKFFASVLMASAFFGCAMDNTDDVVTVRESIAPEMIRSAANVRSCEELGVDDDAGCHAHRLVDPDGRTLASATPAGFGPADMRAAYNLTATGSSSITVAIVDAYGYSNAESDLAVYRSQFGLPPCTTANGCFKKVNQSGQTTKYPQNNTGWDQEAALDLDMVSTSCPSCKILLVETTTASFANLSAGVNTAVALGAYAVSNSYGGGETGTQTYESAYNHPGIAITVSSGDEGYGAEFPASSPHVTAVGGTSLSHANNARGWSETAWNDGGSGCSAVYPKPSWQHDTGCANRTVADVSANADPNTGVAVYGPSSAHRSAWMVFGGTSVSAPFIAGVYGANGGAVSFGSNPYADLGALNDVTSGTNGSCGGSYLCTAGAGYDGPTGLGTPNGNAAF